MSMQEVQELHQHDDMIGQAYRNPRSGAIFYVCGTCVHNPETSVTLSKSARRIEKWGCITIDVLTATWERVS